MSAEGKRRRQAGFSTFDILMGVALFAIVAAIGIPTYLAQRAKAKNADALSNARTALVAAKSYYVDNDTYRGLTPDALNAEEGALYRDSDPRAPATSQTPGDGADPSAIWIGSIDATGTPVNTAPTGQEVVLCSIGTGDSVYCVYDNAGVNGTRAGTTRTMKFRGADSSLGTQLASRRVDDWNQGRF